MEDGLSHLWKCILLLENSVIVNLASYGRHFKTFFKKMKTFLFIFYCVNNVVVTVNRDSTQYNDEIQLANAAKVSQAEHK